jgi:hypothetical protein
LVALGRLINTQDRDAIGGATGRLFGAMVRGAGNTATGAGAVRVGEDLRMGLGVTLDCFTLGVSVAVRGAGTDRSSGGGAERSAAKLPEFWPAIGRLIGVVGGGGGGGGFTTLGGGGGGRRAKAGGTAAEAARASAAAATKR